MHERSRLEAVQRELREQTGVSVLIYEQTCATEKMRRRKRGKQEVPNRRLVINQEVCEGCGDCGAVSNCTALVPVETDLGRKRAIDQTRCSEDMSCLDGFCPSFVAVEGGRLRKGAARDLEAEGAGRFADLPEPALPEPHRPYNILFTGIGGTGVLTASGILGVAAQLDGIGALVLDMTGMSQKNGGVSSHLHFAAVTGPADLHPGRGRRCRSGAGARPAGRLQRSPRSRGWHPGAPCSSATPPGSCPGSSPSSRTSSIRWSACAQSSSVAVGSERAHWLNANGLAERLFNDALPANLFVIGYAWQKGLLPLSRQSIERAVELNGVAVDKNLAAFLWGRRAGIDLGAVERIAQPPQPVQLHVRRRGSLQQLIADRTSRLIAYQDANYAARYSALVDKVRIAERALAPGRDGLARRLRATTSSCSRTRTSTRSRACTRIPTS